MTTALDVLAALPRAIFLAHMMGDRATAHWLASRCRDKKSLEALSRRLMRQPILLSQEQPPAASEESGDDAGGDDFQALAEHYAELLTLIEQAGVEVPEELIHAATEDLIGSGWGLTGGEDGAWSAYHESEHTVDMAVVHAPKGGITVGGIFFPGGRFIPAKALANASPEEKAAIQQITDNKQAHLKGRGFTPEGLSGKVAQHVAAHADLDKKEQAKLKRSFRALMQHHGDLVLHRVDELADTVLKTLQSMPTTPETEQPRRALERQLAMYGQMVQMASDAGITGAPPADQQATTPPAEPEASPADVPPQAQVQPEPPVEEPPPAEAQPVEPPPQAQVPPEPVAPPVAKPAKAPKAAKSPKAATAAAPPTAAPAPASPSAQARTSAIKNWIDASGKPTIEAQQARLAAKKSSINDMPEFVAAKEAMNQDNDRLYRAMEKSGQQEKEEASDELDAKDVMPKASLPPEQKAGWEPPAAPESAATPATEPAKPAPTPAPKAEKPPTAATPPVQLPEKMDGKWFKAKVKEFRKQGMSRDEAHDAATDAWMSEKGAEPMKSAAQVTPPVEAPVTPPEPVTPTPAPTPEPVAEAKPVEAGTPAPTTPEQEPQQGGVGNEQADTEAVLAKLKQPKRSMIEDEAVSAYTQGNSGPINHFLRTGKVPDEDRGSMDPEKRERFDSTEQHAVALQKAIEKMPRLEKPVTVYRGVRNELARQLMEDAKKAKAEGKPLVVGGFSSTSHKKEVGANYAASSGDDYGSEHNFVMRIKADHGMNIGNDGLWGSEDEFLLNHNSQFEVGEIKKEMMPLPHGKKPVEMTVLELRQIPQGSGGGPDGKTPAPTAAPAQPTPAQEPAKAAAPSSIPPLAATRLKSLGNVYDDENRDFFLRVAAGESPADVAASMSKWKDVKGARETAENIIADEERYAAKKPEMQVHPTAAKLAELHAGRKEEPEHPESEGDISASAVSLLNIVHKLPYADQQRVKDQLGVKTMKELGNAIRSADSKQLHELQVAIGPRRNVGGTQVPEEDPSQWKLVRGVWKKK